MYRAYGRRLETNRALPELEAIAPGPADLHLVWSARMEGPANLRWSTLWRFSDGEPWVTVARAPAAVHFRFGRFAEFRVSPALIEISPRGRASDATLRHLLLDQALPLALALEGSLVLHASAVLLGGRAVLFAGDAGAGKSTLAALLAMRGAPVLADDGVLIEEAPDGSLLAIPSYPGLRLFADSSSAVHLDASGSTVADYTRKRRVAADAHPDLFRAIPAPLGRIYLLSTGDDVRAARVSRRDAVVAMIRHAYRAGAEERTALQHQLDTITRCSAALDVWTLERPRDLARAASVAELVAAHHRVG